MTGVRGVPDHDSLEERLSSTSLKDQIQSTNIFSCVMPALFLSQTQVISEEAFEAQLCTSLGYGHPAQSTCMTIHLEHLSS